MCQCEQAWRGASGRDTVAAGTHAAAHSCSNRMQERVQRLRQQLLRQLPTCLQHCTNSTSLQRALRYTHSTAYTQALTRTHSLTPLTTRSILLTRCPSTQHDCIQRMHFSTTPAAQQQQHEATSSASLDSTRSAQALTDATAVAVAVHSLADSISTPDTNHSIPGRRTAKC